MTDDTTNGRLARIESKLETLAEKIEQVIPVCEVVTRHDERLRVLEDWQKRVWSVVLLAIAALIGIGVKVIYGG